MLNKKILFPALVFIISFLQTACVNKPDSSTNTIDIVDVRNMKEPEVSLAMHKHNDVEIFRINFLGEGYKVRYYQTENNALAYHEAMLMDNEGFDKAAFKRLSDTSLAVRLFNSTNKKEKKFEVFGNGSSSGLRD